MVYHLGVFNQRQVGGLAVTSFVQVHSIFSVVCFTLRYGKSTHLNPELFVYLSPSRPFNSFRQ